MPLPALYTHPGRILAFLDSAEGDGDWSPIELAERLGLSPAQAGTACSSLFLEGHIARIGYSSGTRYLAKPSYPDMPALPGAAGRALVPCIGWVIPSPGR
jgi:hypothetical protein